MKQLSPDMSGAIEWVYDDGGRRAAGFRGDARDCVTRAIAIATDIPYREVYEELSYLNQVAGEPRSARNGVRRSVYQKYLEEIGWEWVPTMRVGIGCRVHLRTEELPSGTIIARCSKHICAVIDGVLYDTHDSSRDGTRCVYGFFKEVAG